MSRNASWKLLQSTKSELPHLNQYIKYIYGPWKFEFDVCFVRSHIGWRGNESFLIRVWKPLPSICVSKP